MRKLMWFTIGFTAACFVGAYLASGIWLLLLGVFCLAAFIMLLCIQRQYGKKTACALLGFLVGLVWLWCFDWLYLLPIRQMDGQGMLLDIEVTDYSIATDYGITAEGKTTLDGKQYSIQFYINEDRALAPGDRVEGGFRIRYTGSGKEKPTYHQGKGIFLLCYPETEYTVTQMTATPLRHFAAKLRYNILDLLDRVFSKDTRAFAKALLLGQTNELSFETVWSLKTSGIYHVVAVSGMHVSILFALVYLLCGRHRILTAIVGLPVLLLFAAVAGFSPSIVRACIMQGLMILALLANKEYDPPTALAAAVLLILAINPLSITSVSLQLSVGCMVGIFLFSQRIHDYFLADSRLGPAKGKGLRARLIRWAVGSVSVTLGAISLTTPLCAIYFGSVSLVGILANLLILWVISLVFYGIIASCILGALCLPLGSGIGWILSWPIRGILWVTDAIASIPVAAVYTASVYIVVWLVLCYLLLVAFLKSQNKHPMVLTCCMLVSLTVAVACSWLEPKLDNYRVTAVDVGQGQCLLLQNGEKHYLVDCGGDGGDEAATRAAQLLLSQGIFRLDGVIVTHYDADHVGGVRQLLSIIPADTLYLPAQTGENALLDDLFSGYSHKIRWVTEDLHLESVNITVFSAIEAEDSNESSLCILFQPEKCDILITGDRSEDGERALMSHTVLPDLEILVAGHHGSKYSTSWELLKATRPEVVLISVGADNRYGHPSVDVLERIELIGSSVFRTDLQGTIILRG